MSVYPFSLSQADISIQTPNTTKLVDGHLWLQQASMLEKRLELGHYLSDEARAWLLKPSQPERWALWCELLVKADVNGTCRLDSLEAIRYFDTARRRGYLVKHLVGHSLVRMLEHSLVQVLS